MSKKKFKREKDVNYDLDTLDKFGTEPARPATSITRTENGWTIIRCGVAATWKLSFQQTSTTGETNG